MPSLNISLRSKNRFLLFLFISLVITLFLTWPVYSPPSNPFYTIDPDIPYVSNALLYVHTHQISFVNHPGIPLTITLAFSYWPLRIWAKLIAGETFLSWVLSNYTLFMWYNRLAISILFLLGTTITLYAWYHTRKSFKAVLIGILLLGSIGQIVSLPTTIWAESYLYFLFSLWILFASIWITEKKYFAALISSLISGTALATKFTSLSLVLISISFSFYYLFSKRQTLNSRVKRFLIVLIMPIATFLFWARLANLNFNSFSGWIFSLISHSGMWGSGEKKLIDYNLYLESLNTFLSVNMLLIAFLVPAAVYLFFTKRRTNTFWKSSLLITTLVTAAFIKFPLQYYQLINFLIFITVIVFLSSYIESKKLFYLIIIILAINLKPLLPQLNSIRQDVEQAINLQKFVENNPNQPVIWEWARSRDFSILWGRDWSSSFYSGILDVSHPFNYSLDNLKSVRTNDGNSYNLTDICWKGLYIQEISYLEFIRSNSQYQKAQATNIPGTKIKYIINPSPRCSTPELSPGKPGHFQ